MPFPDHVFRHMPELIGRVQDPETSRFRDMMARIEEFDAQAIADGRGLEWRLTHEAREETRRALLRGREGRELWVFAYGSLIWDPAIWADEFRHACLRGWRRSFCMHLDGGRGSPDRPGLMAALDADPGHACQGVVMRLPAEIADEETRILWMREMIAGTYWPAFMEVETPQGPVEAIAFLANPEHPRHVVLPRLEKARRIAVAEGRLGTNLEYLENLLASLHVLGIEDPEMAALLEATLAARREMGVG